MRSAALKLFVLTLGMLAASASHAQSWAAPPGGAEQFEGPRFQALPPAAGQPQSGQAEFGQPQLGLPSNGPPAEHIASPAAIPAANAAPPPEPALPNWGDYSRPRPVPAAFPPVLYDLAGPPRGFVQPNSGQEYQRIIGDPNAVLAADANLTMGIDLARPDGIAPIGVRGDHTLHAGQMLFSVRYDQGSFDDNFVSSHRVSTASILALYPFAPRRLFQSRETALFEYGVSDDLTLLMTLPFQQSRLDYLDSSLASSSTSFGNPGDITISGLYVLYRRPGRQLHLNFGFSTPTGFLDYQTVQPSPTFPNLPYVIRASSGTYDLLPGLTYRGQNERWTWGAQATGVVHMGLNRDGYEVGDSADLTAWLSRRVTERWGVSARLDGQSWGNVRRADPRLNTSLAPTNNPDMQGGTRLNALFGLNYFLPAERTPGQQFSVEAGVPLYQSLDGPQLGLDWTLIAGWNLLW